MWFVPVGFYYLLLNRRCPHSSQRCVFSKMFLRKGATYRLLGASHMPELMEDHASFANDITLKKFVLDSSSLLKGELCNADIAGNCQYENSVTLDHSHTCTATECDADTVRVVQVSPGIHYEYVRPPCVEQAFYANAKKVIFRERWSDSSCANPKLPYASEACCVSLVVVTFSLLSPLEHF